VSPRNAFLALAILLGAHSTAMAQPQWCSAPYAVNQTFQGGATAWSLCWHWSNGPGLVITHAYFRPSPNGPWINVLWEARVSQIFVPYHTGSPRYLDVNFGFGAVPLNANDCPAAVGGTVIGAASEVCQQVKDRGLAWKDHSKVRRGQELVLWGVLNAANYNYVIEWTFRDDGVILGRVGATAVNLPSRPTETHMHDPMWRLDVDLNGWCCNTVMRLSHGAENPITGAATDAMPIVTTEGGFVWDPVAYTDLHVVDATLKNSKSHVTGYHLMPMREGTSRHIEDFSKFDLWVTRYNGSEMFGNLLPTYVVPPQSVQNADIVLWYTGGLHHIYRDEDGDSSGGVWKGSALIMWTGFTMKPMNLFDATPFYP
jgi:primary-amine oxidase